jgi:hypothetical protein
MTTKERIEKLEAALNKRNPYILKCFNPGKTRNELLIFLHGHGIAPNESLIALYEWHDGVHISSPFPYLIPNATFYSLEQMMKTRNDLIDWDCVPDHEDYFPLLGALEMDMYVLKNSTGEIYYLSPAVQIFGRKDFDSIDLMLEFITECYEDEILPIDQGSVDVSIDKYFDKKEKWNI